MGCQFVGGEWETRGGRKIENGLLSMVTEDCEGMCTQKEGECWCYDKNWKNRMPISGGDIVYKWECLAMRWTKAKEEDVVQKEWKGEYKSQNGQNMYSGAREGQQERGKGVRGAMSIGGLEMGSGCKKRRRDDNNTCKGWVVCVQPLERGLL